MSDNSSNDKDSSKNDTPNSSLVQLADSINESVNNADLSSTFYSINSTLIDTPMATPTTRKANALLMVGRNENGDIILNIPNLPQVPMENIAIFFMTIMGQIESALKQRDNPKIDLDSMKRFCPFQLYLHIKEQVEKRYQWRDFTRTAKKYEVRQSRYKFSRDGTTVTELVFFLCEMDIWLKQYKGTINKIGQRIPNIKLRDAANWAADKMDRKFLFTLAKEIAWSPLYRIADGYEMSMVILDKTLANEPDANRYWTRICRDIWRMVPEIRNEKWNMFSIVKSLEKLVNKDPGTIFEIKTYEQAPKFTGKADELEDFIKMEFMPYAKSCIRGEKEDEKWYHDLPEWLLRCFNGTEFYPLMHFVGGIICADSPEKHSFETAIIRLCKAVSTTKQVQVIDKKLDGLNLRIDLTKMIMHESCSSSDALTKILHKYASYPLITSGIANLVRGNAEYLSMVDLYDVLQMVEVSLKDEIQTSGLTKYRSTSKFTTPHPTSRSTNKFVNPDPAVERDDSFKKSQSQNSSSGISIRSESKVSKSKSSNSQNPNAQLDFSYLEDLTKTSYLD